jgi:tRNA (guanine37-N1)-methyltransferase
VDARVGSLADREISIGDYVLMGGELPALVLLEAVSRHLPGVLGNASSATDESFSAGLLEAPHFTRPAEYRGMKVPDVLLSGDHAEVEKWRRREAIRRTAARRLDLLQQATLSDDDRAMLDTLRHGAAA